MKILSGKEVSTFYREKIREQVQQLKNEKPITPGLAVVLVGEDPASQVYVRNKGRACNDVGIQSFEYKLPATTPAEDLKKLIVELNQRKDVHGILVQLPLPRHLNSDEVLSWIDPKKDPDALTVENMGLCWKGLARVNPCTPSGVMAILNYYNIPIAGKYAVVIGRSNIVGKPMAHLLQSADATVTICHSKTVNLQKYTQQADIVVVAAGKALMLGREDIKQGAVVIDVGMHRLEKNGEVKLCGDVRFNELEGWAEAATPVPGGVGPMTITMLLANTLALAQL
ncbi:MAG: bifunctional methylenetetrahydrofolate dehydrogenase/methenyltetrahydrofolate cyclohydrolase FolD [Bdellovibrionales bacterium]|nr:bifunctional methylenetetrahydrofolate dehydrogenase/methenyltetrahydrofolate cyclohydrolase FolD [Bdellovibrionales bacterium]